MSGSDIRDILQIGKSTESGVPRRAKQPLEKRPEGISRELYSLIGGAPSVSLVMPTYKAKFNVKKKATPWIRQSFTSEGRSDDLAFNYWIKAKDANDAGQLTGSKSKPPHVLEYTDDDYNTYLADLDKSWTKEETDYMLSLCRTYGLRFPVIEDRYDFKGGRRTVVDLKDRYYSLYRALLKKQPGADQHLIQRYAFDKEKEIERKQAIETLYSRTRDETEEEEKLLEEIERIEQNESRLAREKENVESLLAQLDLALKGYGGGTNSGAANNKGASEGKKRKRGAAEEGVKRAKRTIPIEESTSTPSKEKLAPGVHIQSQRLPVVKTSIHGKVLKVMELVGVRPRPVMPTAKVCHGYEQLQNSITVMFELKKVVDKMEMEHKIKTRNGTLPSSDGATNKSKRR